MEAPQSIRVWRSGLELVALICAMQLAAACHDAPTTPGNLLRSTRIAYVANDQLHVVDLDGSNDSTVTPSGTRVYTYEWHPTTQRIVYRTYEPVVHILDRKTGTDRVVTSLPHPEYIYRWEWSPDGDRLLVVDSTHIIIIDATGGNPITLGVTIDFGRAASWSADGRYIATTSATGAALIIPLDGSAVQTITLPSSILEPRFSPNGDALSFESDGGIWVAPMTTLAPRRILGASCTTNCGGIGGGDEFGMARWSPDGSKLAGFRTSTIWTAKADGSGMNEFPRSRPIPIWWPQWSPDGSMIAFAEATSAGADIVIMRPDGSAKSHVTHVGIAELPSWVQR